MSPRVSAANQKLKPSPALAAILGSAATVNRVTAAKLVWQYIQNHNLQLLGYPNQIAVDEHLAALLQGANLKPKKVAHFYNPVVDMVALTRAVDDNLIGL